MCDFLFVINSNSRLYLAPFSHNTSLRTDITSVTHRQTHHAINAYSIVVARQKLVSNCGLKNRDHCSLGLWASWLKQDFSALRVAKLDVVRQIHRNKSM